MFKLFKRKPIPDYQTELSWKYPERPVLMAWHRWAIPHSGLQTGGFFILFLVICLALGIFFYTALLDEGKSWFQWKAILIVLIPTGLLMSVFCAMLFEHRIYVYRCTAEGLEVCSWKEGYKKAFFVIKIALILGTIAIIFTAIHTKQIGIFFMAFVGPAGIGLMSLSSMSSEKSIEYHRDFKQDEFTWHNTEEGILIDNNRKIISIYGTVYEEQYNLTIIGSYPIFCDRERFEEILAFIKQRYPNLPCKEQRAKIDDAKHYIGKPETTLFTYIKDPNKTN